MIHSTFGLFSSLESHSLAFSVSPLRICFGEINLGIQRNLSHLALNGFYYLVAVISNLLSPILILAQASILAKMQIDSSISVLM